MKICASYLDKLFNYAEYQNIQLSTFDSESIEESLNTYDVDEKIDSSKYLSAFNRIAKSSKIEDFGLNFGSFLNLDALGLVVQISLNTSSIEQGVLILDSFLKDKFPLVEVHIKKDENHYIIHLESIVEDVFLKKHLLDLVLGIIYREVRLMIPSSFAIKIKVPDVNLKPYQNAFEVEVSNDDVYQIELPLEIIHTEINENKINQIELLLPKFLAVSNDNMENNFTTQVRKMTLNMCTPEVPNFEKVLKQFPLSKRTVQRKLTNEGTSFRQIVNKIKEELSNYLKNEKHLKIKDIAYILGYSEPSAYLHAVKSWSKKN